MENLKTPLDYAKATVATMMRKYAAEELPPKEGFHYHQGVFLSGMQKVFYLTNETKYYEYSR